MKHRKWVLRAAAVVSVVMGTGAMAADAKLAFRPGKDGSFDFDTGLLRGRLAATQTGAGVTSLIQAASGRELTKGSKDYGLFSFYRLLAVDQRWGEYVWGFPKTAKDLPDGSVRISWPSKPEHPFDIQGTFRWAAPDTLDVLVEVTPQEAVRRFELFLGSYFADTFSSQVYVRPRGGVGDPRFLPVEVNPLIVGTYLSFPRDHKTAAIIYDGRWLKPPHPVDWAVTGFMAAPLVLQQDGNTACVLMARPQDCFVVSTPYNMPPPQDGVASHHSTYFSLFGTDLQAGQKTQAYMRLVVGKITPAQAVERYREFLQKYPEPATRPGGK